MTGLLDRLERRGLIERRPNPADRRSTLVALTSPGRDAAGRVADAFRSVEARVPASTATALTRLLAEVEAALSSRR